MFRRDAFALIASAVVGSVVAVYASLAETPYFPASFQGTLGECPESEYVPAHRRPILTSDEASWFGHTLLTLHEAPLSGNGADPGPTLRLTLSAPYPLMVRVTRVEGKRLHLIAKWPQGRASCKDEQGCVFERILSPAEQERLGAAVEPLLGVPSYGCDGLPDASSFMLEVTDGETHRMWHQRSPRSGNLLAAAILLAELAEWPLADELAMSANRP